MSDSHYTSQAEETVKAATEFFEKGEIPEAQAMATIAVANALLGLRDHFYDTSLPEDQ